MLSAFNSPCLYLIPSLTVVFRTYPKSRFTSQFISLVVWNSNSFKFVFGMLSIVLQTYVIRLGHYLRSNPLIFSLRFFKFDISLEHCLKYVENLFAMSFAWNSPYPMHYKLKSAIFEESTVLFSSGHDLKRLGLEKKVWSLYNVFSVILLISAKFIILVDFLE